MYPVLITFLNCFYEYILEKDKETVFLQIMVYLKVQYVGSSKKLIR
jgi:hypothetical protein